ncbi:MAG: hypothetical protein JWM57_3984 [Phycisphaerales bacterium]|nr:hypothetical protein [Phycisphaerales bacterium]
MMRNHQRRGAILVYAFFLTMAMAGMVALAVDWGRMQVTKSELRSAADAAARFAVAGLQNDLTGSTAAYGNAASSVAQNRANGQAINFIPAQDVDIGIWSTTTRTFVTTTDLNVANAVRVTLRCTSARGTAVPLTFLPAIGGRRSQDITAVSIAMIDYTGNAGGAGNGRYEYFIPATSNPWLSGMPKSTVASGNNAHDNPDYAGDPYEDMGLSKSLARGLGYLTGGSTNSGSSISNYSAWGDYAAKMASPIEAGGIAVSGGSPVTFDGLNGGANNMASSTTYDADGNTGSNVWNVPDSADWSTIYGGSPNTGAESRISNVHAPLNSVIGVFLDDKQPNKTTGTPAALDFSSSASRDFATLSPKLKQPFFIGDGRDASGDVQQFIPPAGATRLFIGTMDEYEWSNNVGGFYVTAHAKGRIITVK